jgi:ABC-type Mn2+/Zn2+ transport system permease subunit
MKAPQKEQQVLLFSKKNYTLMLVGLGLIALGNILMIGNEDIYSFTKITLAPVLIMAGFLLEIYAIMFRPKKQA